MSFQLVYLGLIALGRGELKLRIPENEVPGTLPVSEYQQPEYSGYQQGSPFDFGITSPLQTAPDTPLYGLENVGTPIDAPFFLGYSQRPEATNYVPLDLEIRNLLSGGL